MSYTKGLRISDVCERAIEDDNGTIVAVVAYDRPQAAADALLFVASSPMLEALEATICMGCENRIGNTGEGHVWAPDWRKCSHCKAARAAIALAKGENHG